MVSAELDYIFKEYSDKYYEGFLESINDFYDEGYPYKEYLDKNNINRLIGEGKLILTLAISQKDEVVGTVAALMSEEEFKGSVLLLLRSVPSHCRGRGIASNQLKDLFDRINKKFKNIKSFYADVMTHDDISQISLCHRGYTLCGIRCSAYKNQIIAPKITFKPHTKMSQAVYCKAVENNPVCIALPKEHKDFILDIYSQLGIGVNVLGCTNSKEDSTQYRIEKNEIHEFFELFVTQNGVDFEDVVVPKIKKLLDKKYTAVAYINICDSGFLSGYNALLKEGFYFSGIKPLSENREYLILSNSKNCQENFNEVNIFHNEKFIKYILGGRQQ